MQVKWFPVLCLLLSAVCGCGHYDGEKVRREHAAQFPAELAGLAARELSKRASLDLKDCVDIALANNLDVQTAQINKRLANLDRKIAFSNFLPHINIELIHYGSDKQQQIGVHGDYNPMSDRAVTETVLSAQQAIFAPEAWFLYDAYTKREDISKLVARRTRDLIRLQVATLYFSILSIEQARGAIGASLTQADEMLKELKALAREGIAMPSQVEQVRTIFRAQQVNLAENKRIHAETCSALLEAMGLSPFAAIHLEAAAPLAVAEQDLADQILQAMLQRPEMYIADAAIEIHNDDVRMAISRFLPIVSVFAEFSHTTDSFLKYSDIWTSGVSGVLNVFDGFANIHAYQAAKQRKAQALIAREQTCMQIMLEVIKARSQYVRSLDNLRLAQQELVAAKALLGETQAKWREGLLLLSERLDAVTRHSAAAANVLTVEFQAQVATATLLDVMGVSPEGKAYEKND